MCITFLQQTIDGKLLLVSKKIDVNSGSKLKLVSSNNLLLKIYCKNIMDTILL